ncbi:flagellar protein FlgN [Desulfovibrio sp. OttesenSCG-928-O18]|nr:flagellar protein FlgN [Desulfovibrio sp. OttesenSCG-928-O18]
MTSFEHIHGNLVRQMKGMELLVELLEEEFALLRENNTEEVVALEFSIHELLRQLATERMEIKSIMQDTRVMEYAEMLEPEQGALIKQLAQAVDDAEQKAARQATHNTRLSLALLDQSQELLDYLHEQVTPKPAIVYGRKGTYNNYRPQAALLSGRT